MEPRIDAVRFGTITVGGEVFRHDIVITLDGDVVERPKRLSKAVYGTSHTLSLAEAEATFEEGADTLIVGCGHFDRLRLSPEAEAYLAKKGCTVELRPTKRAAKLWNKSPGPAIGLFHITC